MVFLLGFVLLFFMKNFQSSRLLGYSISFFTKGFFEKRAEEKPAFFSTFHVLLFFFSVLILTLFLYAVLPNKQTFNNFNSFLILALFIFTYLSIRYIIDYSFSILLGISEYVRYFIFTKSGYLYSLSIWLFPVLIIYFYGFKNSYFLWVCFIFLIILRFVLVLHNNKKLIIKHLFYFILYLCALEIAPLFILIKILK